MSAAFTGAASLPSAHSSYRATANTAPALLIYWHLLSLDAPTVAMLWTWFIAKTSGVYLALTSVLAMGVAVWVLYAADRLLDSHIAPDKEDSRAAKPQREPVILSAASRETLQREAESKATDAVHSARALPQTSTPSNHNLEPRHLFHRLHRRAFLAGIAVALLTLAVLVPRLPAQSLRLYTVLGTLLAAYFALIHKKHTLTARIPKEIAVGIFFSAATFIPTVARDPVLRGPLLPAAILFGLVCTLNCLFIYAWEHPEPFAEAHPTTRLALSHLPTLAVLAILASFALAFCTTQWRLPCTVAIATVLLLLLHANRRHLDRNTLRAAADLCLLTPIAFAFTLK